MANEIKLWNKVLASAMQLRGVKVYREPFLKEQLSVYCTEKQITLALEKGTIGIVDERILDEIALECIHHHTLLVTGSSILLGIPGGWAMMGSIPGDVAQYYFHVFVLSQKLAYIYGYPDLCDENGNFTETASGMLTIFVGVMSGVGIANKFIQELAESAQKEVIKRIPQYALTKTFFYPIIKQIAKWLGKNLTKDTFAKSVSKFVPILGGAVSGFLSYNTFKPQSKKLMYKLKNSMLLAYENKKKEEENAEKKES